MDLVLFKNFSKRNNSTKRPDMNTGRLVEVSLKQDTSLESPVFLIEGVDIDVNYCYWQGHYYFVNEIVLGNRNIYELHCSMDVLATFKDVILNTKCQIEYSSTGDRTLPDNRIPVKTNPTFKINQTEAIFSNDTGKYYVSVTGQGSTGLFEVDTQTQLGRLVFDITDVVPEPAEKDVFTAIWTWGKNMVTSGSLSGNIRSCFYMPYDAVSGSAELIKVGLFESGCIGKPVTQIFQSSQYSVLIPWQFNDWRNTSPYTEVYLYIPYIGTLSFPSSNLKGVNSLTIYRCINVSCGSVAYQVNAGSEVLGCYSADIGVPIPIGSSNIDPMSATGGLIGGASAVLSDMSKAGKVLAVTSATLSGIKTLNTNAGGLGGGAGAGLDLHIKCFTICHGTTVEPNTFAEVWGYPLGIIDTIGNHSGYVQCSDASVSGSMHNDERSEINNLLNSGIYIE